MESKMIPVSDTAYDFFSRIVSDKICNSHAKAVDSILSILTGLLDERQKEKAAQQRDPEPCDSIYHQDYTPLEGE